MSSLFRRLALAMLTTLALGAGALAPASQAATTKYNRTDAAFASMMLPHHLGGVELGKLAASKGVDPTIRTTGANIVRSQSGQAKTLAKMVKAFRTKASTTPEIERRNQIDMARLKAATGTDFDKRWLDVISSHHMAAIQMAQMERRGGINAAARALASKIIREQRAELSKFNTLTIAMGG